MPRRIKLRKVVSPPGFRGFRPYGAEQAGPRPVDLLYEEYEAIKLADYDKLNHLDASVIMGVSRATFARIYECARGKIAQAMVEIREIRTRYGNAVMDESWHLCQHCHARFTMPPSARDSLCPICRSADITSFRTEPAGMLHHK